MEKEEKDMVAKLMGKVMQLGLSWYHQLFLAEMAIEQYDAKETKTQGELATIAMTRMPELCQRSKEHAKRRIVAISADRSLERLEEELHASAAVPEDLLLGDVIQNVLDFLLEE